MKKSWIIEHKYRFKKDLDFMKKHSSPFSAIIDDIRIKKSRKYDLQNLIYYFINLKKSTENINYKCNFDSDGICKDNISIMCCCAECFQSCGYLFNGPNIIFKSNLKKYIRYFSSKIINNKSYNKKAIGFWREGKGCILPREMRSHTCLSYHCTDENISTLINLWNKEYKILVKKIIKLSEEYDFLIKNT